MLIWWIDTFRRHPGNAYRWHVAGVIDDAAAPEWTARMVRSRGHAALSWSVPNLQPSGGRYVFRLRPVSSEVTE